MHGGRRAGARRLYDWLVNVCGDLYLMSNGVDSIYWMTRSGHLANHVIVSSIGQEPYPG
jgi:hypothetical protein